MGLFAKPIDLIRVHRVMGIASAFAGLELRRTRRFTHPTPCQDSKMSDSETAQNVFKALKLAEHAPAQQALPILNGLVGLLQGNRDQPLEVEEARSSAFLAICEV